MTRNGVSYRDAPFDGNESLTGVTFKYVPAHRLNGMTGGDDDIAWPAAALVEQMQDASEETMRQQQELFRRWLSASTGGDQTEDLSQFAATSVETATFKTRVQSGGRISIPDVEREALNIAEGDIVQAIVIPVKRNDGDSNV